STFKDIKVELVGTVQNPYELSVASARTCYSGRGVIYPQDISKDEKAVLLRDKIAASTLEAGHLTTRQHAHFVFALSGVSRQFIWSFLHSHPFYNSEQVSQRYVKVKSSSFVVPPLSEKGQKLYEETIRNQMATYEKLIEVLRPPIRTDYYDRFKSRRKYSDKWDPQVEKRLYEVARYALGVGTTAYLYHTVSALTLLRYWRLCQEFETPQEQRVVVQKMLEAVKALDPLFEKEIQDPVSLEKTLEFSLLQDQKNTFSNCSLDFIKDFDRDLDGRTSKLVQYTHDADKVLADSFRTATGRTENEISNEKALQLLLDPKMNPILADSLNAGTFDRLSQIFHHVHFTFKKKISHTADSQDQRHRMVMSSRPLLATHFSGKPDFITPYGITQSEQAHDIYTRSMEESFAAVSRLIEMGESMESAFYLLPNSTAIRMISSGDLQAYQHKWKMRSCYNAQEEIFQATIDEIQQVKQVAPAIAEHLRAPCYLRLRAGITPYCPEGDRYCGLPVWKYSIDEYQRKSL
ncbi:FAD-dependent thymidylate synthase, partial [bacterium]|nr:FAD-dependent thymidylate synthase [bacterium]